MPSIFQFNSLASSVYLINFMHFRKSIKNRHLVDNASNTPFVQPTAIRVTYRERRIYVYYKKTGGQYRPEELYTNIL